MTSRDEPIELARLTTGLLRQYGVDSFQSIQPIVGGRNNRAFRISGQADSWLLKIYFHESNSMHNRCESEWSWSTFCWNHGVEWGPKPLATDQEQHASLFEYVSGRHLNRDEVGSIHVEQAVEFIEEVNVHRHAPDANQLPDAAEACFSLEDHVYCVTRRIDRLSSLSPSDHLDRDLHQWLKELLIPMWKTIADQLRSKVTSEQFSSLLPPSDAAFLPRISDFTTP